MAKKELFLEEAILDDLAENFDSLELPLSERAFRLVTILVIIVTGVALLKMLSLGSLFGNFYGNRASLNADKIITAEAERGVITDRYGKILASNVPNFRLVLKISDYLKDTDNREQILEALQNNLNITGDDLNSLMHEVDLEKQNSIVLARNLTVEQAITFKNLNSNSLQVESDYNRSYPYPEAFSHVLGYTGIASKDDLAKYSYLSLNDIVGKSGLEGVYDESLRGEDGKTINYRNAKGEIIGEKLLNNPRSGYKLETTIDADLQSFFYKRLEDGIKSLGSKGGVGIALNPEDGEVLALVNVPSFNNSGDLGKYVSDPMKPLFNRAISGVYTPGSTIKPLVATAALTEGVIDTQKTIYSPGYIDIPNPYDPTKPSRFLDWRPQGWVNIYSAIARSCNVFFYEVGGGFENQKGLGIEKLRKYWQLFALNQKSGIDLPGENNGFLPAPDEKEKRTGQIWRLGDTYNVSIGQGDLMITPLELINYISSIANGGKIYKPFIVQRIVDENSNIIKKTSPTIIKDNTGLINAIREVQKGMRDTVVEPYGTAYLLHDLPFSIAAKTGSSQIELNTKINALFVGYAPADSVAGGPQIAILILIEDAREGSLNTIPIAKDVLRWYYDNRLVNNRQ